MQKKVCMNQAYYSNVVKASVELFCIKIELIFTRLNQNDVQRS